MCVLRAANPLRISSPRLSGRSSAYRGARQKLSRRLSEYVVLAHDPDTPLVAADYWLHSLPFYRAVVDQVRMLARLDPACGTAFRRLAERPADVVAEDQLEAALAAALRTQPRCANACAEAVSAADNNVYIGYFRGAEYRADAPQVTVERLYLAPRSSRTAGDGHEVAVIIPIMDRDGTARVRNLLACLLALHDQTFSRDRVAITVVEFDSVPRWQDVVGPLADHYVHARGTGRFNKSWAYNLAVRQTAARSPLLCLLDADILPDREFLERNHARFAGRDHDAHLPHTEMLSLDAASTNALIEQRHRTGKAPLPGARGLLLREVPGGCLWLRSRLFREVGGFDERYSGWGGEDEDMLVRVCAAGAAAQFDDVLLHMSHPRPPMRTPDGLPFNSHIKVGSWTGADGYGNPAGPGLSA